METELALNEYYFAVHPSGYILKTKSKDEYGKFLSWSNKFVFQGVVKNNQYLHYKVGQTWNSKSIKQMYTSKDLSSVGLADDTEVTLHSGSQITKCEIGGKSKAETYESL